MRLKHIGPLLAVAILLAACSSDSTSSRNQVNGQVQSITPPTLNVGGRTVTTTGGTLIVRGTSRITLPGLHEGEPVRVSGVEQSNGAVMADEIDADEDEVEFHGIIDSIVAPDLFVGGHKVVTDSATRITREEDVPLTFADLKAGDTVKVEGKVQTDSSVLAHRIRVGSDEGDEGGGEVEDSTEVGDSSEIGDSSHGDVRSFARVRAAIKPN